MNEVDQDKSPFESISPKPLGQARRSPPNAEIKGWPTEPANLNLKPKTRLLNAWMELVLILFPILLAGSSLT
jgi:hypothetical protein